MSKMNPAVKTKWVAALRSGDYAQGRNFLRTGGAFCCLGVLCDLHANAGNGAWRGRFYDGLSMGMPEVVGAWAGVDWGCGPVVTLDGDDLPVAVHNDDGRTFAEIADAIEAQL